MFCAMPLTLEMPAVVVSHMVASSDVRVRKDMLAGQAQGEERRLVPYRKVLEKDKGHDVWAGLEEGTQGRRRVPRASEYKQGGRDRGGRT